MLSAKIRSQDYILGINNYYVKKTKKIKPWKKHEKKIISHNLTDYLWMEGQMMPR